MFPGRDIVVLDQRGVGFSQPELTCLSDINAYTEESLLEVRSYAETQALATDLAIQCGQEMLAAGVDLSAYTTTDDAADVNDIRLALGMEQITLYGVSYGTRSAQAILREYPDTVSAAILDSVIPPAVDRPAETPTKLAQSFERLFAACTQDAACNSAYPDLEATFYQLVDQLNANPATIMVTLPDLGQVEVPLTGDSFMAVSSQALYFKALYSQLPQAIYAALEGDFTLAAALTQAGYDVGDLINFNKFFATECRSEVAYSDPEALAAAYEEFPRLRPVTGTLGVSGETVYQICAAWGLSDPAPEDNDPVTSAVPTLLLAGQIDPVTPPEWARQVAEGFSQAYVFEFEGVGHSVLGSSLCAQTVASAFLADPSQAPAPDCLQTPDPLRFSIASSETLTLTEYANADLGITSLIPDGWTEAQPGVIVRGLDASDQTIMVFLSLPAEEIEAQLADIAAAASLTLPEAFETYATEALEWQLYRTSLGTLQVIFAVAEDSASEQAYLVILQAQVADYAALEAQALLPALDAFQVNPQ